MRIFCSGFVFSIACFKISKCEAEQKVRSHDQCVSESQTRTHRSNHRTAHRQKRKIYPTRKHKIIQQNTRSQERQTPLLLTLLLINLRHPSLPLLHLHILFRFFRFRFFLFRFFLLRNNLTPPPHNLLQPPRRLLSTISAGNPATPLNLKTTSSSFPATRGSSATRSAPPAAYSCSNSPPPRSATSTGCKRKPRARRRTRATGARAM